MQLSYEYWDKITLDYPGRPQIQWQVPLEEREEGKTQRHWGEGDMKREAEIGAR